MTRRTIYAESMLIGFVAVNTLLTLILGVAGVGASLFLTPEATGSPQAWITFNEIVDVWDLFLRLIQIAALAAAGKLWFGHGIRGIDSYKALGIVAVTSVVPSLYPLICRSADLHFSALGFSAYLVLASFAGLLVLNSLRQKQLNRARPHRA